MRKTWMIVVLSLFATALLSAATPDAKEELAAGLKAAESYDWPGPRHTSDTPSYTFHPPISGTARWYTYCS